MLRLAVVFGLLALSGGCLRLDMSLQIRADDTVDGVAVVAYSVELLDIPAFAATEPPVTDDLFDDFESGSVRTEPFDDGEYVGTRYVFTDVDLVDFDSGPSGASEDSLGLRREGDYFLVAGSLDMRAPEDSGLSGVPMTGPADAFDLSITMSFPGAVLQSNGEVSGETVVWELRFGERNDLFALASAGPRTSVWLWGFAAAVVLIASTAVLAVRAAGPPGSFEPGPVAAQGTSAATPYLVPFTDPDAHPESYDWVVEWPGHR